MRVRSERVVATKDESSFVRSTFPLIGGILGRRRLVIMPEPAVITVPTSAFRKVRAFLRSLTLSSSPGRFRTGRCWFPLSFTFGCALALALLLLGRGTGGDLRVPSCS